VRAYKFLDATMAAPFTAIRWSVDGWIETATATPCHEGVHGCRPDDVSWWLADAMWEIELDGAIVATRHKVAGSRGRLLAPVDGYAAAVRELGEVGAWRSRDRAVVALRAVDDPLADRFAAVTSLDDLAALGAEADDATWAGTSAGLAADAAHFARHGDHAQSPFVAACSAGHHGAGPSGDRGAYDDGYEAERVFQSRWLSDRLSLR
jgi:hypothetical protein